jgi:hypothetical protein
MDGSLACTVAALSPHGRRTLAWTLVARSPRGELAARSRRGSLASTLARLAAEQRRDGAAGGAGLRRAGQHGAAVYSVEADLDTPSLRLPAVGTLNRCSKALEYEYRVKTAALGTLK